jgi:hypothetical protein
LERSVVRSASRIVAVAPKMASSIAETHGVDLSRAVSITNGFDPSDAKRAVDLRPAGERPFRLDSPRPAIPLEQYAYNELRYRALVGTDPAAAKELLAKAQQVVTEKYRQYEELASRAGDCFHPDCTHHGVRGQPHAQDAIDVWRDAPNAEAHR